MTDPASTGTGPTPAVELLARAPGVIGSERDTAAPPSQPVAYDRQTGAGGEPLKLYFSERQLLHRARAALDADAWDHNDMYELQPLEVITLLERLGRLRLGDDTAAHLVEEAGADPS